MLSRGRVAVMTVLLTVLGSCGGGDAAPDSGRPSGTRDADAPPGNDLGPQPDAFVGPSDDAGGAPTLDAGGGTSGGRLFPDGAWFYQRVDTAALRADSRATTQWLTDNGGWGLGRMQIDFSLEVLTAASDTPLVTFERTGDFYSPDCDAVMMPVPAGGALEGESGYSCDGDGDCHLIVIDRRVNRLFEMWRANMTGGTFFGGCVVAWDMTRVYPPEGRGEQCTSADAAGFPIAPLLFTADEVAAGEIDHAIRFILPNERMRAGYYVRPASHAGGPRASDAAAGGARDDMTARLSAPGRGAKAPPGRCSGAARDRARRPGQVESGAAGLRRSPAGWLSRGVAPRRTAGWLSARWAERSRGPGIAAPGTAESHDAEASPRRSRTSSAITSRSETRALPALQPHSVAPK
jgi:hypothetical protein